MNSTQIRQAFLDYFKSQGHIIVPSSSLVPMDDPSVLLTTAGMQQFKPYFLEPAKAQSRLGARRATSVQKCFRTSDIDEVGDTSHLTFFEMLGNFSFGDYFKEAAITWAWEFITKVIGIAQDRTHVTIFAGDSEVPRDDESFKIWRGLGVPESQIKAAGRADNFWGPTGDEGPCGPTTEIYVDGLEVWNLVFNEFFMAKDGHLTKLRLAGVDTGMGFERLLKVVLKSESLLETDVFSVIKTAVEGAVTTPLAPELQQRAERIITDHLRAATFLIVDGVRPSNVKQGYILRRLLRRVIRYEQMLGMADTATPKILKAVAATYATAYPELGARATEVESVINAERASFAKALRRGLKEFERIWQSPGGLTGEGAFKLYESYGFPYELTRELAKERGGTLNKADFDAAFLVHQQKSRPVQSSLMI